MFLKQPQTVSKVQIEPQSQPWVEKYRPKTIDDVSSQEHTVAVLRKTLTSSNLPHMLFYGPPGTGKTSTILALARQLYGPDNFRSRVLELNASDERGIAVVREKIKTFARQTPRAITVSSDGQSYPYPPYKIIILDEADSMTQDAQAALRRIMETYVRITRFCLVCNYVTRIIEPLASRCSKFRFTPLSDDSTRSRLEYIASQESIPITSDVISTLIQVSGGDLRKSITYLQSTYRLSLASPSLPITTRDIEEIAGTVPEDIVKSFVQRLGVDTVNETGMDTDNSRPARSLEEVRTEVRNLIRQAWGIGQLLLQLHDVIILHPTLTSVQKSKCAFAFAEADKALGDGGDEELWLLEVAVRIWKAVCT